MTSIHLGKNIFSIIKQFQHALTGCSSCQAIWIPKEKVSAIKSKKNFSRLSVALAIFNQLRLNYNDLLEVGIEEVSYGFCSKCTATNPSWAPKIKARQRSEGNPDCFGTARNGYCDRFDCDKRLLCVHDRKNPPGSMGFFRKLFDEVQHHLIAN